MMPEPSCAPEVVDPEMEPEGDPKGGPDIDELFDRSDAASMEGAINKFMEGLEGQERSGFPQIHRLLSLLPVPVQKKTRIMTHAEAIEGQFLPNMTEEEQKRFTPSELVLYKHALEYKWSLSGLWSNSRKSLPYFPQNWQSGLGRTCRMSWALLTKQIGGLHPVQVGLQRS